RRGPGLDLLARELPRRRDRGVLLPLIPLRPRRLRHPSHPGAQPLLVVEQVADVTLGVGEVGGPEARVEGADLHADAAVHAQRVVDVEAVQDVLLPRATTAARWRFHGLLVRVDRDAPVGALAGAEHAGGAVLLQQGDDAAAALG